MSLIDRKIWFNGNVVNAQEAVVNVLSPTAQFGLNVFEGVRCYFNPETGKTNVFRLDCHLDRLWDSCKIIGIEPSFSKEEIKVAIRDVIEAGAYGGDIALRITFFVYEEGSWQNSSPVGLFIAPIEKKRNLVVLGNGATSCVSSWRRLHDSALPTRVKAGCNYINGRYAHIEAQRSGYDLPIFLDHDGFVSEGAGACLFIVKNGTLITPDLSSSILESITRDTLIKIAQLHSIPVFERKVNRTELYNADEVFLCGSAAELTSILSVDGYAAAGGQLLTKKLSDLYFDLVDAKYSVDAQWLFEI